MKRKFTHFTPMKTGRSRTRTSITRRKNFSSNLSDNYKMVLQLYCLSKTEASIKKELKYKKLTSGLPAKKLSNSSVSIWASIGEFFSLYSNTRLFKKVRQGISTVTG